MVKIHSILFGGKYNLIFLQTKSTAVCLFHQSQIQLLTTLVSKTLSLSAQKHNKSNIHIFLLIILYSFKEFTKMRVEVHTKMYFKGIMVSSSL